MQQPLKKQVTLRLAAALFAGALAVAGATYVLHERALNHARQLRQQGNEEHFRDAIDSLHQNWEQAAQEFRTSMEFAGILDRPALRAERLNAFFLSLNSVGMRFSCVIVADRRGRILSRAGYLPNVPSDIASQRDGWLFDDAGNNLYHLHRQQIWLGREGMGALILLHPFDNALLRGQAFPDTDLFLLWQGRPVASSLGQEGIDLYGEIAEGRGGEGRHIVTSEVIWKEAGKPGDAGARPRGAHAPVRAVVGSRGRAHFPCGARPVVDRFPVSARRLAGSDRE